MSPIALEAVKRIDTLFAIEREINGLSADERRQVRQERSRPLADDLRVWLGEQRSTLSRSATVAKPIDYMLRRWDSCKHPAWAAVDLLCRAAVDFDEVAEAFDAEL